MRKKIITNLEPMESIDNTVAPPGYSEYNYLRESNPRNNLANSRRKKNDEFYTQITTIENELVHYRQHFRNKVVFCNCDDYLLSQFFWYFARNFNHLKLKKLITASYNDSEKGAVKVIIDELSDYNGDGAINDDDIKIKLRMPDVVTPLGSNGEFQSPESIDLLKQSDIVVTNPPFSLFRNFINLVQEYNKKFLIVGNNNAISYKEIIPLILNKNLWLGVQSNKTEKFKVPEHYKDHEKTIIGDDGNYYAKVSAISWFTNLEHKKRSESFLERLYQKYDPNRYPIYENFNAIEVKPVAQMPVDFAGLMGVPITYLTKHNPDEFEIIGSEKTLLTDEPAFYTFYEDGKRDYKYARLIIRNKHPKPPYHTLPERDIPKLS